MSHSPSTAVWSLTDTVASRQLATMPIELDLNLPSRGIVARRHGRDDQLLGVDLTARESAADTTLRPVDHWLRGGDLAAVYEPADARHLRATAMWRMHDGATDVTGWEVVVSAQTSLLESDAAVAVVSTVEADDLLWNDGRQSHHAWQPIGTAGAVPDAATCILIRRDAVAADATSLLIAVHPADHRRIIVTRSGHRARIECWLFSSAIEKGVLLRSRVLAAIGPAQADTTWAERLAAGFAASPPPLTT
ncbi:MAG: hypothetical protein K8S94_17070 [Planctomycetia bacterium]|nr:hypothetical protein [Planctomycetia bacterium]